MSNGKISCDHTWKARFPAWHAHERVLCIQDTTELNFNGQEIKGLGPLSYESQRGMFLHPTYAVSNRWACSMPEEPNSYQVAFNRLDMMSIHGPQGAVDKGLIVGDKAAVGQLVERLEKASSHSQYQRIQCVLIRTTLGSSAAEITRLPGWSTATVHVMYSRWAKEGEAIFEVRERGGRRHQHLTQAQEAELRGPFVERAQADGMLSVAEIEQAHRERTGKAVTRSTIYRLLELHGWRKIVPPPPGTRRRSITRPKFHVAQKQRALLRSTENCRDHPETSIKIHMQCSKMYSIGDPSRLARTPT